MTKKVSDHEIDVLDLFLTIWNKKYVIIFITIIAMTLGFLFKIINKKDIVFVIKSEIRPITVFEEAKYKIYNSFIKSLKPYSLKNYNFKSLDLLDSESEKEKANALKQKVRNLIEDNMQTNVVYNLEMIDFDKKFLFNLFLDKLSKRSNLERYMKESKLIDQDDNISRENFKKTFLDISSSIRQQQVINNDINKAVNPITIEFESYDLEKSKDFLKFIEKEINFEIQKNVNAMFDNYINYVATITKFKLEDINSKISIIQDPLEIKLLETNEEFLLSDKYIDRIKSIYRSSPISRSDEFYAAKINYELSDPKNTSSMIKVLIVSGFFGLILGIMIALISKALESRRLN
jgi:hypothetical protein